MSVYSGRNARIDFGGQRPSFGPPVRVTPELLGDAAAYDHGDFQDALALALAARTNQAILAGGGMTREDWLTSPEPRRMLSHLGLPPAGQVVVGLPRRHRLASDRKLRLLAVAVAQHGGCGSWASVGHFIAAAYRMADGGQSGLSDRDLEEGQKYVASWLAREDAAHAARYVFSHYEPDPEDREAGPAQADLIRCVMGDVFEPVALGRECPDCNGAGKLLQRAPVTIYDEYGNQHDSFVANEPPIEVYCKTCLGDGRVGRRDWLTSDVLAVAREIYRGRRFGDCPVLADALEDAGCTDGRILEHLRGGGPHALGCWAVDLMLGKE